jgi:hypothetical protein
MTERGTVEGPPTLVTSFGEFERTFGGFVKNHQPANDLGAHWHLPLAVKQYFDNGGKRAFIVRAYKYSDSTRPQDDHRRLQLSTGVTAQLRASAPKDALSVFVTSLRGFEPTTTTVRKGEGDKAGLAVTKAWNDTRRLTLKAKLTEPLRADTAFVASRPPPAEPSNTLLVAREPGVWGEQVGITVQHYASAPVSISDIPPGDALRVTVSSPAVFYKGCTVLLAHMPESGELKDAIYTTVIGIDGNSLTLEKPENFSGSFAPDYAMIALAEVDILVSWRALTESFRGSWRYLDRDAPPSGMTAREVDDFNAAHSVWMKLHTRSTLVRLDTEIKDKPPAATLVTPPYVPSDPLASHPCTPTGFRAQLVNATKKVNADGTTSEPAQGAPDQNPGIADYNGDPGAEPGKRTGIEALTEEESIALVAVPGIFSPAVQSALITHCEKLKYRFAVIDGPHDAGIAAIRQHRNNYDSKYAALYYPWITIADPLTGEPVNVPPSGTVLGIYGRSDGERGVHKAPANEVTRNATGVVTRVSFGEQEVLNPEGIDVIRDFQPQNRAIRVWGARTVSSDPEWKYVNVRRLFIFIEHSIDKGTQWVVFEPNNSDLWRSVRRTVETFLFPLWQSGALLGDKAEQAYYVRCDRRTMSQDDIDNGRLIVEIGIAPTKPAEFVIFRIGQLTADANQK